MKKYLLLFVTALALGFASCSDDETIPNLTGIAIESEGGVTEVIQGGTLALTANYTSNVNPEVRWEVNGEVKSTDKEFSFTEAEPGKYYVTLVVSTEVGEKRVNLPVTVYGKYKYGTFVLNEGNFGNPPSSLIFISPENEMTEEAYFEANGTHLGVVSQDLFIANNKMYIISQNGGEDGMLVIANAETLKKEKGFSKDQLADLNWPTHVAALDDSHVYIRDNNGVHLFDPTTTSLSLIEGTDGAIKNRMAVTAQKVFAGANNSLLVIKDNKVIKTIALEGTPTGVVKASDGNVWVSVNSTPAKIMKVSSKDYSILKTNELESFQVSAGWGATPAISAKGDSIYFSNAETKIYLHDFAKGTTKEVAKVGDYIVSAGRTYNNLAVNPKNGDVYVTTIKGYGTDYLINSIGVFSFADGTTKLVQNYQNVTRFPAGVFFTYDFE